MAGCGATGQKDISQRTSYGASFAVEELSKLKRPSLHPDDFKEFVGIRDRYKKFSTSQNRGIICLSQGCSDTTLGTRLGNSKTVERFYASARAVYTDSVSLSSVTAPVPTWKFALHHVGRWVGNR